MVYFKCCLDKQLEELVSYTDEHRQQLQETFQFWKIKINLPLKVPTTTAIQQQKTDTR